MKSLHFFENHPYALIYNVEDPIVTEIYNSNKSDVLLFWFVAMWDVGQYLLFIYIHIDFLFFYRSRS